MLKSLTIFLCSVITLSWTFPTNAEISINELIFSNEKPFHLKLLDVLPNEAKIEYGPKDAKNTIIEFMDYYCGFCKKINPELISIADERDDVRLVFLHYPIISENSKTIAKFVIAAGFQNKNFDLHHEIFLHYHIEQFQRDYLILLRKILNLRQSERVIKLRVDFS